MPSLLQCRRARFGLIVLSIFGPAAAARASTPSERERPGLALQQAAQLRLDQSQSGANTLSLRRGRVGLSLTGVPDVSARFEVALDGLTLLPSAASSAFRPRVQEARVTLRLIPDAAFVSVGFFRPQLGRESLTSGFVVDSLDKASTQAVLRRHLTGEAPGNAPGIDVGGQLPTAFGQLRYDVGVVERAFDRAPSLIALSRISASFGAPEAPSYNLSRPGNDFGRHPGLTVSVEGSQGVTDQTHSIGADALWRFRSLVATAEVNRLWEGDVRWLLTHARVGFDVPLSSRIILEPWAMASRTSAEGAHPRSASQLDAGLTLFLHEHDLRVTAGGAVGLEGDPSATRFGLSFQARR